MPSLAGSVQVFGQEVFSSSSTPAHQVGAIGLGSSGRVYRYAKAGTTDLIQGRVLQSPAEGTNRSLLVCRATAAGASSILFTNGATALTANEFAGGSCVVTGAGQSGLYTIAGHRAIAGAAAGQLDLDGETVQTALTTSNLVTLVASPYRGVVSHPAAATGVCAGSCVFPILANQYGWVQTGGPGMAIISGTPAIGQPLTSVGSAGALTVHTAELNHVAWMMVTGVDGNCLPVWWLIG
jgi:hypothetical protein